MPFQTALEGILKRRVNVDLFGNSETSLHDWKLGYSKHMTHLRTHRRVSVGLMCDVVDSEGVKVKKIDSTHTIPDVLM